jgi:hypothetical protein
MENIILNYLTDKIKICVSSINLIPAVQEKKSEYKKSNNNDTE